MRLPVTAHSSLKGEENIFFSSLFCCCQHKEKGTKQNFQTPYGAIETLLAFSVNIRRKKRICLQRRTSSRLLRRCFRAFRSSSAACALGRFKKLLTNKQRLHASHQLLQYSSRIRRLSPLFCVMNALIESNPRALLGLKTYKSRLRV